MSIKKELKFILPPYIIGIPPEHAPILCDRLVTNYMDSSHALLNNHVCLCEGWESSFSYNGILYASVVVLLEGKMRINPDTQPACCVIIESYGAVSDYHLCWQNPPEVLLVAFFVCELCRD